MWCDDNLIFLLDCTERVVRSRLLERLSTLEVSYENFRTLLGLAVGDDIPQHELGSRLCLEPTYTARMLQRAEQDGLVTRVRDKQDARVVRVQLSPKGRQLWRQLAKTHEEFRSQALSCFTNEEREQLRRLLMVLRNHAAQVSASTA
jgi:DNA-binding MarR family transcriptional regulator